MVDIPSQLCAKFGVCLQRNYSLRYYIECFINSHAKSIYTLEMANSKNPGLFRSPDIN